MFPTQSASLNGTNQGFSAADNVSLSPTGDMTLEAWIKLTAEPGSGVEYDFITKHDNGNTTFGRAFTFGYINSAGTKQIIVRISSTGTSAGQVVGTLNHTFGSGTWHHIAMSYVASTGIVTIVKNGTSLGTITGFPTSIYDSTIAVTLGIRGDLTAAPLNGRISMARLWKGLAKSTSAIDTDKCTNFGNAQTSLSAEWSLNNVLTDTSGNANTLTNLNTTTFGADVTGTCSVANTSNFFAFF